MSTLESGLPCSYLLALRLIHIQTFTVNILCCFLQLLPIQPKPILYLVLLDIMLGRCKHLLKPARNTAPVILVEEIL